MNAVGRAAQSMVEEVRRQFREIKVLEGKATPIMRGVSRFRPKARSRDVAAVVLAIVAPVLTGFIFGVAGSDGLLGLLVGGLGAGFVLAILWPIRAVPGTMRRNLSKRVTMEVRVQNAIRLPW